MHEDSIEETVSTLRFAQRAKKIRNRVKMNIRVSPDYLRTLIENLRNELRDAYAEIVRLRGPGCEQAPSIASSRASGCIAGLKAEAHGKRRRTHSRGSGSRRSGRI